MTKQLSPAARWLIFLAFAWLLIGIDLMDGSIYQGDVDDRLRNIQILHLYQNGGWFDPVLPMISMPEPYASPWSRLVDLPYLALASLFGLTLSDAEAVHLATLVWPPLLMVAFSGLFAATVRRMTSSLPVSDAVMAAGCALLAMLAVWEFSPGRSDHHNMQLTVVALAVYGVMRFDVKGGILSGIGVGASWLIGLEALPFLAVMLGCVATLYIMRAGAAGAFLSAAGGGLLVTLLAGGLVFVGPAGLANPQCDAFSIPYLLAGAGAGLVALIGPVLIQHLGLGHVWQRLVGLGAPGALILLMAAWLFPLCLSGPYHMIDEVSASGWLHRAPAEQNALYLLTSGQVGIFVLLLVQAGIWTAAGWPVWKQLNTQHPQIAILWMAAGLALLMAFITLRNMRFAMAIIPLFLPLAISALAGLHLHRGKAGIAAAGLGFVMTAFSATALAAQIAPPRRAPDVIDVMAALDCEGEDFSVLETVAPGNILAPLGMGLPVIEKAPPGFTVSAIPFHRASPGIRRTLTAFTTTDPIERQQSLSSFDYVAVCLPPPEWPSGSSGSLFSDLTAAKPIAGLKRVLPDDESRFALWQITAIKAD